MRPKIVTNFEILFFVTLALGLLYLLWSNLLHSPEPTITSVFLIGVGRLVLFGILALLVSRKRSKIAFWILIVLTVITLLLNLLAVSAGLVVIQTVVPLLISAAQMGLLGMLFSSTVQNWMSGKA